MQRNILKSKLKLTLDEHVSDHCRVIRERLLLAVEEETEETSSQTQKLMKNRDLLKFLHRLLA